MKVWRFQILVFHCSTDRPTACFPAVFSPFSTLTVSFPSLSRPSRFSFQLFPLLPAAAAPRSPFLRHKTRRKSCQKEDCVASRQGLWSSREPGGNLPSWSMNRHSAVKSIVEKGLPDFALQHISLYSPKKSCPWWKKGNWHSPPSVVLGKNRCDIIHNFILNAKFLPALSLRHRGRRFLRPNHPSPHEAPSGPICMEGQEEEEEESSEEVGG